MTDVESCTQCAGERKAGAAFCEKCGRVLATGEGRPPGTDCAACGSTGSVAADGYCGDCGMLAGRPGDHREIDHGAVAAAVSDRGRRHRRNEDAMWLAVRGTDADLVVCDGVSSSYDPDVASATAAEAAGKALAGVPLSSAPTEVSAGAPAEVLADAPTEVAAGGTAEVAAGGLGGELLARHVAEAVRVAADQVAELVKSGDPRREHSNPACTIVAACVRGTEIAYAWAGDSRAYWVPTSGEAVPLTEDDSWASIVIAGGVDPEVAWRDPKAHAITAWLGADYGEVRPRTGVYRPDGTGHLVLCTDGLWNYFATPSLFASAVRTAVREGGDPLNAARELVAAANQAGGSDNITVALVPLNGPDPDRGPAPGTEGGS
jgi:PPM family protein phosphatase